MPRRFLKADNREALSDFPGTIEESDLITHFLLTPNDLEQVKLNRNNTQRMGFAVLLCGLQYLGFFPNDINSTPDNGKVPTTEQRIGLRKCCLSVSIILSMFASQGHLFK